MVTGVSSIRVSHLIVPAQVGRGHDAQLHCHFNLGGNILYSVKWFKGKMIPCFFVFFFSFHADVMLLQCIQPYLCIAW